MDRFREAAAWCRSDDGESVRLRLPHERLRASIANLAAPPEAQAAYLDTLFARMTGGGSAEGYGNGELIEEFDDIWSVIDALVEQGDLIPSEFIAVKPLGDLMERHCNGADRSFWLRPALYSDARWDELRQCAARVMLALPERPNEDV